MMNQLLIKLLNINPKDSLNNYLHNQVKILLDELDFSSGLAVLTGGKDSIITSLNMTDTQAEGICDLIRRSGLAKTVTYINETLPPPWSEISRYHFRSSITFPLIVDDEKEGYIILLSPKKYSIPDNEEGHLNAVSKVISIGYMCNKLQMSENQSSLLESIDQSFIREFRIGFVSFDEEGGIIQTNPALLNILGPLSVDNPAEMNVFTYSPLVESGVSDLLKKTILINKSVSGTYSYETKQGKKRYFHLNATPVKDANGNITGGMAWFHDITEQVQNSAILNAINRSNDILQNSKHIRESIDDVCKTMLTSLDVDCILTLECKSPRSFQLFNITGSAFPDEIDISSSEEYYTASDLGLDSTDVKHLLEGKNLKRKGSIGEKSLTDWISNARAYITPIFCNRKPLGLIMLFDFKGIKLWPSILSEQMKVLSDYIGYSFGLRERDKKKTKSLAQAKEPFVIDHTEIMDLAPFALIVCERDGKICEMNETALELLVDFSDINESQISHLPSGIQDVLSETLDIVSEKITRSHTLITPDGDRKHLRIQIKPIEEDRILVVIEDSTESQETSRMLSEEIRRTETSNQAKSEFLANMSHEIRTPLNALLGFSQLMSAERLPPKARDYLLSIQSACESLEYLTSDLLDVTRIEAGQLTTYPAPNSLNQTIDESVMMMKNRLKGKDAELLVDFTNNSNLLLHIFDKARLKQILINLISNAIKFTEKGRIIISCGITHLDEAADEVVITIDDSGIGIPKSMRESIFSVFTQINSSVSKKHSGTGLGLSIVKGIVQSMDGQINVIDKEEPGARFEIRLTLERARKAKIRGTISVDEILYTKLAGPLINIGFDVRTGDLGTVDIAVVESSLSEIDRMCTINPKLSVLCIGREGSGDRWVGIPKDFSISELKKAVESLLASSPNEEDSNQELDGLSVLVVEDNALNIKLVEEILRGFGCRITVEDTGEGGVKRATEETFDICLMDVQMPDVSGLDATMQIRYFEEKNQTQRLPIIALTAYASVSDRERCLTAGMDGYVAKPIKISELISTMKTSIKKTDMSILERLSEQLLIAPSKLRVILRDYVSGSLNGIEDIKRFISSKDYRSASEVCHKLKGMAYFEPLLSKVIKLGKKIKEKNRSSIMETVSDLECEFNRLGEELGKEQDSTQEDQLHKKI